VLDKANRKGTIIDKSAYPAAFVDVNNDGLKDVLLGLNERTWMPVENYLQRSFMGPST
jgi:hypothetical protein